MKQYLGGARDLFGVPIDPYHGCKGRPRHKPTDAMRQRVAELRGEGLSQAVIAIDLGITIPTLMLNYPQELGSSSSAALRRAARDRNRPARSACPERPSRD